MTSDNTPIPGDNRDRGILTKDDRQFLRGEKEYGTEQSERDARYRIRQRIKDSILDFSILLHHLDRRDREQIFQAYEQPTVSDEEPSEQDLKDIFERSMIVNGISDALGFFYLGAEDANEPFEEIVESGVVSGEEELGYLINNVDVSIDIEREKPDVDELVKKFQSGEPLSREEITAVIRSGELDLNEDTLDKLLSRISEDVSEGLKEGEVEFSIETNDDE